MNDQRPIVGCFGGGLDSTTLVAMDLEPEKAAAFLGISRDALRAALPAVDAWVFSDTGAEHTHTYEHLGYVSGRLGDRLHFVRKDGETILEWNQRLGTVPVMPGGPHVCSLKFKGSVMQAWAEERWPGVSLGWLIGIEANEASRAGRFQKPKGNAHDYRYPLIDLGITREDCIAILQHLDWPVPGKSSCVHCPFKSIDELRWMYHNDQAAWQLCADLEENFREASSRKHQAWLDAGQPLNAAGRAPKGMWRLNSWEEGARLFARSNGGRKSMSEWAEIFAAEIPVTNLED